jgi:hypothetical protein
MWLSGRRSSSSSAIKVVRLERDANPIQFSPDDATFAVEVVGLDDQREIGRDAHHACNLKAPVSEKLRTVHSMPAPPNAIVPAFKTRCLGTSRLFVIVYNL